MAACDALRAPRAVSPLGAVCRRVLVGLWIRVGSVSVDFTSGDLACDSTWVYGEGIQVTFLTELGALPEMETTPSFPVNRTAAGTKENAECGGHGICDFSTGLCTCMDGWGSSDGDGTMGNRGDCGYHYDFCTDKTQEDLTDEETFAFLQATSG